MIPLRKSFGQEKVKGCVTEGNHYQCFLLSLNSLSRSSLMIALRFIDMKHIPNTDRSFKLSLT